MKIFLTGATGFVGQALCASLQDRGDTVVAWVRDPVAARAKLGESVELVPASPEDDALGAALATVDAVVKGVGKTKAIFEASL